AAKAEPDRSEPEIPVFKTELHALVEARSPLEHGPPDEAAGFANVLFEVTEHRVRPGVVAAPFLPEHVDVGIDPADARVVREDVVGALQSAREKPIVGVEKINCLYRFPSSEHMVNAGVARRAEAAILSPDVRDAIGCGDRKVETSLVGL